MKFAKQNLRLLSLTALFLAQSYSHAQDADADQQFFSWLDALRLEAADNGISAATLELALPAIDPPVRRIIDNDRSQPEVMQTYSNYLQRRLSDWKKVNGKKVLLEHADDLSNIASEYGVQPRFIAAIWGRAVLLPPSGEISLPADAQSGLDPDQACRGFQSLGAWRQLQDWQKLGVRRLNATDLPSRSISAALIVADNGDDKGYLVYRNFCSIMKYNPSFRYALSIGLLADQFIER